MITIFKIFEKVERTFNVGDIVVWIHDDHLNTSNIIYIAPRSKDASYGDICQITAVKGMKGKLYAKAKNLKDDTYICNFLTDGMTQMASRHPEGHWFECKFNFIHKSDFKWKLTYAIKYGKNDIAKNLIKNYTDLNSTLNDRTPLMIAASMNNMNIVNDLIIAGADWNKKTEFGFYFLDFLDKNHRNKVIKKFPNEYDKYLAVKEGEKFNL